MCYGIQQYRTIHTSKLKLFYGTMNEKTFFVIVKVKLSTMSNNIPGMNYLQLFKLLPLDCDTPYFWNSPFGIFFRIMATWL